MFKLTCYGLSHGGIIWLENPFSKLLRIYECVLKSYIWKMPLIFVCLWYKLLFCLFFFYVHVSMFIYGDCKTGTIIFSELISAKKVDAAIQISGYRA